MPSKYTSAVKSLGSTNGRIKQQCFLGYLSGNLLVLSRKVLGFRRQTTLLNVPLGSMFSTLQKTGIFLRYGVRLMVHLGFDHINSSLEVIHHGEVARGIVGRSIGVSVGFGDFSRIGSLGGRSNGISTSFVGTRHAFGLGRDAVIRWANASFIVGFHGLQMGGFFFGDVGRIVLHLINYGFGSGFEVGVTFSR